MLGGRSAFDNAIRLCGAKLVIAPTVDSLKAAITPQTAMIYTTWKDDRVPEVLKISKPAGVPVLLDAAAGIPPFENFTRFARMGVDLYCFSGGKGFRGPQCSGLLLGRQDLITAALANTCPWEGSVCRAMKVGKEEVMGILAGVDYWAQADSKALNKEWTSRVERIAKLVGTVPGVTTDIAIPETGNSYPDTHRSVGRAEVRFNHRSMCASSYARVSPVSKFSPTTTQVWFPQSVAESPGQKSIIYKSFP